MEKFWTSNKSIKGLRHFVLVNKEKDEVETMLDDTPWDINADNNLAELPMGVDVSIGLKILGDEIPQINSTDVYDWNF